MRDDAFTIWLKDRYPTPGTWSTYRSDCRRLERHVGDLDEHYRTDGMDGVLSGSAPCVWSGGDPDKPLQTARDLFRKSPGYRTAGAKYFAFCEELAGNADTSPPDVANAEVAAAELTFGLERDLQQALRENIQQLEHGLEIVDGGAERYVSIGRIDITARDAQGRIVTIELKAVRAGAAAVSQIAAYMGAMQDEEQGEIRGILVAPEFDERARKAARVIPALTLVTYRFSFSFDEVDC